MQTYTLQKGRLMLSSDLWLRCPDIEHL